MAVKHYYKDEPISPHFRVKEFQCKDGSFPVKIDTDLVAALENVRSYFGKPVTINSGHRTELYNKKVGGAKNSQHVKGKAADIVVEGVPSGAVQSYVIDNLRPITVGTYRTFTHVDTRPNRTTFKGDRTYKYFEYRPYKAKPDEAVPRPNPFPSQSVPVPEPVPVPVEEKGEEDMEIFSTIDDLPEWAKIPVKDMVELGILKGVDEENLKLTMSEVRTLVWLRRMLIFMLKLHSATEDDLK